MNKEVLVEAFLQVSQSLGVKEEKAKETVAMLAGSELRKRWCDVRNNLEAAFVGLSDEELTAIVAKMMEGGEE